MSKKNKKPIQTDQVEVNNSLNSVLTSLSQANQFDKAVNQTAPLTLNNRGNLISNDRTTLSYLYVEHGLIQTLVDQPVDDAFRAGFDIKTAQLDPEEIEELQRYMIQEGVIQEIVQVGQWGRLYGGGSLLVITDQDPSKPFNPKTLRDFSRVKFMATDMWELYNPTDGIDDAIAGGDDYLGLQDGNYMYYGRPVDPSRVLPFKGKQAPSFLRRRLRGWGMSEVERVVTSFNQYLKNNNVIYELLDEAKVDIYKIDGLNQSLINNAGSDKVTQRIQTANMIKNFINAITMDTKDEYDQKTMSFTGLSEVLLQIRQGIASDLKMPITKLFGVSSTGFNSGEDDIENYNSMIESQVRSKMTPILMQVVQILSQKLFGTMLDDLEIEWGALRVLSSEQEEAVKDRQFNRTVVAFERGLIDAREAKEAINKNNLLPTDINEDDTVHETGFGDTDVSVGVGESDKTMQAKESN